ncbi:MAG: ABC transporter ATP-binding protein, partial [Proteobacteria bacterium]|nr:ABC transporter ATP-binding protein [Pseudomonadota bacterium]
FIVGREVLQQPCVLVCAQPTWGVDVGAAAELRQALKNLRDSGCAILLISEDIDEIFALADRVVVAFEGRLSRPQPIEQTSATNLGLLMAGVWQSDRQVDPLQASVPELLADRKTQRPFT